MPKLSFTSFSNLSNETSFITALNANFSTLSTFLDTVFNRNGTSPNTLTADVDANSQDINNVATVRCTALVLDGTTITGVDSLAAAGAGTIDGTALTDNTVDGDKILTNSIPGTKLEDASVDLAGTKVTGVLPAAKLPAGTVLQVLSDTVTTRSELTGTIDVDDTVPAITDGTLVFTKAITPGDNTNKVKVDISALLFQDDDQAAVLAVFRGSTCVYATQLAGVDAATSELSTLTCSFMDSPATTSATTYTCRVAKKTGGTGPIWLNGNATERKFGGVAQSVMFLTEVSA